MARLLLTAIVVLLALPAGASAVTTRIIGGDLATQPDWEFAVALETTYGSQFCGGTLVAPQWVLTAGHCRIYSSNAIQAVAGTTSLIDGTGERIGVDRQVRHPDYRQLVPGAPRDDLMLVHLEQPSSMIPIERAQGATGTPAGTLLHVAGWGSTSYNRINDSFGPGSNVLRQTPVRVQDAQRCIDAYGARAYYPQDMVCASLPGKDACAGDSGGPLVDRVGPGALLIGVVSWGTGCALRSYPGVYSLVSHNHCWIDGTVNAPVPPSAVALGEGDGTLTVDWAWTRPCAAAPQPAAYRVRVAETGAVVDVPGDQRETVLAGLPNGTPLTVSVTAINGNGESTPAGATGVPGPNPVTAQRAVWTGYRTGRVTFTLAPHGGELHWRSEAGTGLRFAAAPWQAVPPSATPQTITADLTGLAVGKAIDVRMATTDTVTVWNTPSSVLPEPVRPAPIGGPHIRGALVVGSTLYCTLGRWTGTRPFAVTRQWLLDGRAIRGGTGASLAITPARADGPLACRVEISGPGGITRATSPRVD